MRAKAIFTSLILLISLSLQAKKILVPKNYYADASVLGYRPGYTLLITTRASLLLGKINGQAGKPVYIIAAPGAKLIGDDSRTVKLVFQDCHYIQVENFDIKGMAYGKRVHGMQLPLITDAVFKNIKIDSCGIGIFLKNAATTEPRIKNIRFEHIRITNATNEGMYAGNTDPLITNPVENLTIIDYYAENTGWDGLQLTLCFNVIATNITLINSGYLLKDAQSTGLAIQALTSGTFKNIVIKAPNRSAIQIFGRVIVMDNVQIETKAGYTSNGFYINNVDDRGLGLPLQKITLSNITIKGGGTGAPIIYGSNLPKPQPGIVTNLVYDKALWSVGVVDAYNTYVTAPVTPSAPVKTLLFQFIDVINKKTISLNSDSTWSAQ